MKPLGDLQSFENEWMEVEVLGPRSPLLSSEVMGAIDISGNSVTDDSDMPAFLCDNIDPNYMDMENDDCKFAKVYLNSLL